MITINEEAKSLCIAAQFTNVTLPATGFHIHLGPPTAAGPIVIPYASPTSNVTYRCVTVQNADLLHNLVVNPGQHCTNIHTVPGFAAGAIRGQLSAA